MSAYPERNGAKGEIDSLKMETNIFDALRHPRESAVVGTCMDALRRDQGGPDDLISRWRL